MQENLIRVVLVDDHEMIVEALTAQLQLHPRIRVVGSAHDSDQALRVVEETSPDVVVMDVHLPGRGSFESASEIQAKHPKTRIVLLSGFLCDVFVAQALRLCAAGYLMKGERIQRLIDAITGAVVGETTFSEEVAERVAFDNSSRKFVARFESDLSALTGRQLEVLRHLARGQSVKEIARVMHLSQKSVDSHKYRIMNKLGIHDRVELARFAIREGLMVP